MKLRKYNKNIVIFFFLLAVILLSAPNIFAITDSNLGNNILNKTVNVVETKSLKIYYIGMDNPENMDSLISNSNTFIQKTFPVEDDGIDFKKQEKSIDSSTKKLIFEQTYEGQLMRVWWNGLLSGYFPTHSVAIVPSNWFETHFQKYSWAGTAPLDTIFRSAIVEESGGRHITAHEMAHPYGLCDEYNTQIWEEQNNNTVCPNAKLTDTEPDTACFDEETGCNTETVGKLVPWNGSSDMIQLYNFMGDDSKENFRWISNKTYSTILNELTTTQSNFTEATSSRLVIGGIWSNGSTEIKNIYPLGKSNLTLQSDLVAGDYNFKILDSSDQVILNLSFTPSFSLGIQGDNATSTNFSFFVFVVNDTPDIDAIQLSLNETMLEEKNKTANTPTLNLTFPLGGELVSNKMDVAYNSTDADGDEIDYAILISSDSGNTYSTLEIDHPNETYSVNTSSFTEGQEYKVKVLATDGINTNTTVSEGTFEIDNDLRITDLSTLYENLTKRTFFYVANNTLGDTLNNVKEELNTGESIIELTTNHSLASEEDIMVFIEYDYSTTGEKEITATAQSGSYFLIIIFYFDKNFDNLNKEEEKWEEKNLRFMDF